MSGGQRTKKSLVNEMSKLNLIILPVPYLKMGSVFIFQILYHYEYLCGS